MKKIHFIAIGGALMHNLALALQTKGYEITGSDDEIYDPSRSRLEKAGLLPDEMGWHTDRIHEGLDAVILGMHARPNNPELQRAKELGLLIYSYPEFLYLNSKDKKRVVIGGSHGKTTTTSIVMHVLKYWKWDFDYAVGANLEGFDLMVRLSDAPIIVIEGDEYLSSPIDRIPKFLHYRPHVAILTGIAWDHMNVFPTFKNYKKQFKKFVKTIVRGGSLIYYKEDPLLAKYATKVDGTSIGYTTPPHTVEDHMAYLCIDAAWLKHEESYQDLLPKTTLDQLEAESVVGIPLKIFGRHNLQNIQAARLACRQLGLTDAQFLQAIQTFTGAAKRLQRLFETPYNLVFKDFAHAPSKVGATVNAVKQLYTNRKVLAVVELHTFSSLNKDFIQQYAGRMDEADVAFVYYNEHTLKMKKLPHLHPYDVEQAFDHPNLRVFTNKDLLMEAMMQHASYKETNFLFMSSGRWNGLDFQPFLDAIQKSADESK